MPLLPLLLTSFTFASAVSSPALTKRAENITGPYYLKTKVIHGGDKAKDDLYVRAYHTGMKSIALKLRKKLKH